MTGKPVVYKLLPFLLSLLALGCATIVVPRGGSGRVSVMEGGLVETLEFEGGPRLNIQITNQDVDDDKPLLSTHMITIGKYSRVVGSGFTSRSNIYYESRIDLKGHDGFVVGGDKYRLVWRCGDWSSLGCMSNCFFEVTVGQVVASQD